jgi:hypothetical protein
MRADALTGATNQISQSQFARTWQRRLATHAIAMETLRHLT